MPEEALMDYIPLKGHRVLLKNFRKENAGSDTIIKMDTECDKKTTDKDELIKRIKGRLAQSRLSGTSTPLRCSTATRVTPKARKPKEQRSLEISWCTYHHEERRYIQVRKPFGGGTRHVKMPRAASKNDILLYAIDLFSPFIDRESDIDLSLDVRGLKRVGNDETIETISEREQMKCLRFYIHGDF